MFIPADSNQIRIGDVWVDRDERNTDRGKTGRARPKHRAVEIVALPTLSSPGVTKVIQAPRNGASVGKLKRFTRAKLVEHYVKVS